MSANADPGAGRFGGFARPLTLVILATGYVGVLLGNLPGHMTYDSVIQLLDGRTGRYHLWHPPVMAWLLGVGDRVAPGPGLFVVANAGLLFASLGVMVWRRPRVSWAAPLVAAAMVLSPLLLIYQAIVWKDVLFANAAVSGFLWLSIGARLTGVRRGATVAFALVLFTLAVMTRQNGAVVLPLAATALVLVVLRRQGRPALGKALALGAAALILPLVVAMAGQAVFSAYKAERAGPAEEMRTLQMFDVVGALRRDPAIDLTPFGADAAVVRAALKTYTPTRVDTVAAFPGIDPIITDPLQVPAVWRDVVLHHTPAYLAHRIDVFAWTVAPSDVRQCLPVAVGVNGPLETLATLGMAPRYTDQDRRMSVYAARFFGTPVYSHLFYGLVAILAALALLRSRDPGDAPILMMIAAMALFTLSFALISLACDYRYLYAVDVAAMAAALRLACGGRWPGKMAAAPSA